MTRILTVTSRPAYEIEHGALGHDARRYKISTEMVADLDSPFGLHKGECAECDVFGRVNDVGTM